MATPYRSDDLIARARDRAETLRSVFPWGDARLIARLADALEAAEAERDAAVKELRDRELHHFEVEQELAAALAVIDQALAYLRSDPSIDMAEMSPGKILLDIRSSVPADVLRERDRRVQAEAVKEFRVNDLRDRAERADERWKAWGDVNDAELRDRLFQQAAAVEQNSEGNET